MNTLLSFAIRCFRLTPLSWLFFINLLGGCSPSSPNIAIPPPKNQTTTLLPSVILETRQLIINHNVLDVEVAKHLASREKGLMERRYLPENHGMLFVFPIPQYISMWMKNTLIPLDVAFIDAHGIILNIETMKPQTLTHHPSQGAITYALEMNAEWFKKHDIHAGQYITYLPPYQEAESK
jgi:uncharacterized protein